MIKNRIVLTLHILGQGGTDRVACILASGFANAGFDTTLLVFCDGGEATTSLHALISDDVNLIFLGHSRGSRTKDLIYYLRKCAKYLADIKPDYVMSTGNNINWITAGAVRISGIDTTLILKTTNPIINSKKPTIRNKLRRLGYNIAFKYADIILPLSEAEQRQLTKVFPKAKDKFHAVINPYVTPAMLTKPKCSSPYPDAKIILGVGRFQKQKRFDLLIRAFALVTDSSATLVILGDGPDKGACENLVNELGISERVILPGFVTDVASWYHHASVFVLSSDYEGLPAVVLEALAANCPVLATNCFPAAREILDPLDNCKIIDPPTIENMASLIDAALKQKGTESTVIIAAKYSIENGILSHLEFIQPNLLLCAQSRH